MKKKYIILSNKYNSISLSIIQNPIIAANEFYNQSYIDLVLLSKILNILKINNFFLLKNYHPLYFFLYFSYDKQNYLKIVYYLMLIEFH